MKQLAFELDLLEFLLAVLLDGDGVGVDDHDAGVAVDDQRVTRVHFLRDVFQADDRRDAHGIGDDGGVAGLAAGVDADRPDLRTVQRGSLRRRKVVGNERDRLGDVGKTHPIAPLQLVDQPPLDVVNIFDAVPEISVFLLEKLLGVFAQRARDGVLRGEPMFFNALVERIKKRRIVEQAEMEVEDRARLLAEVAGSLVAQEANVCT